MTTQKPLPPPDCGPDDGLDLIAAQDDRPHRARPLRRLRGRDVSK